LLQAFFMGNYMKITIALQSPAQSDVLVALLSDRGFTGFEEDETETAVSHLHAFIPEENFNAIELIELLSSHALTFSKQVIQERNWNEDWEQQFQPVVIGSFCAIRAHFHSPISGVAHEIIITPKMSFGTGHHPTTCLMVEAMESIDFFGKSVIDFGTGTGVLAILAEKLGAKEILAIDNDDWSIENAKENISQNGCTHISIQKNDRIGSPKKSDIILANINKNTIIGNGEAMRQQLQSTGVLLVSGLLTTDLEEVRKELGKSQLVIERHLKKENWICLQLKIEIP
jgi:ribosomal protein L11 methyltransferase